MCSIWWRLSLALSPSFPPSRLSVLAVRMVIKFTKEVAREQRGADVRAGGREAQSTCQYYLSMGNVEVFEKVRACWAAPLRYQETR